MVQTPFTPWSPDLLRAFVDYVSTLKGDEKGEAQVFCERLFQAFGHHGYKEAGAVLEHRVKFKTGTKFADLLWLPRVLIEMKKRGEKLQKHYRQAFDYWLQLVPMRPRYVILCNFDEFWIYDFNAQLDDPVDIVRLDEIPTRYTALNFLFPEDKKPIFGNDRVAVTREAADKIARIFNSLITRGENRERAQRFVLQCVVSLFAEDFDLLPRGFFTQLIADCRQGVSTYDLFGGLFRQMNDQVPARGGRYKDIRYFDGGLFAVTDPVDLKEAELELLAAAAADDWSKVQPPIFGTLFQSSMDQNERHAFGAHFTSEADIQKVVLPTIVRPWRERIAAADTLKNLLAMREEMRGYRVLDPACGSGNFLYVAYRELKRLEMELLSKIHQKFGDRAKAKAGVSSLVNAHQFFGIDINPFAVELAKVTLMLAKEQSLEETRRLLEAAEDTLPLQWDEPLPLENLDDNIRQADALFCQWPQAHAIIGNPPYLGSRYLAKEHGYDYANRVYEAFPDIPKMADYCAYWFRRAHDHLTDGGRAGLVGTNTIRQNETRQASLDHITDQGGTITEAISTQVWSGDAAVHVSIVNWVKGQQAGPKLLFTQMGDDVESPWKKESVNLIPPTLATGTNVTEAVPIRANDGFCYTGQNPVNAGFFLSLEEGGEWLSEDPSLADVIFPYMIGRDMIEAGGPTRYIIDFAQRDKFAAMRYAKPWKRIEEKVMPVVLERAEREKKAMAKEVTRYTRIAQRWWQFYDYRPGTIAAINAVPRYVACSRVTKRPIFAFVNSAIHADTTVMVFKFADDYSFGVLQSEVHTAWFKARCSTLESRFRYTSDTVFDSFPWPQNPTLPQARAVAAAAVALRALRRQVMTENNWSLRDLYRAMEKPGRSPLNDAHDALDAAVRAAFGMSARADPLAFVLDLNRQVSAVEKDGKAVVAPGLPPIVTKAAPFITSDGIFPPALPR